MMGEYITIIEQQGGKKADVCVCVSLYNYQDFVIETLESVAHQTLAVLDLVIVDDSSVDASIKVAANWAAANCRRFNNFQLVAHRHNEGLAVARNTGFSIAASEYIFVLDADNALYPRCISRCLQSIISAQADFAFCIIERFVSETGDPDPFDPLMGVETWSKERLRNGNYIDAMALVRKAAWGLVGGYRRLVTPGWEDYDFLCRFAENDLKGVHVPEILCRYRVHEGSMLQTITNKNLRPLVAQIMRYHPWLDVKW